MADFTDLVWEFFPKDVISDIFFQCRMFFPRNLFACFFSSRNQPAGHFFLKSPTTLSKVKWPAPKIHQSFGQLTDSDLSIISKGFWDNRGQNSQGERGRIRFYLPLPGKYVRSYIRHNQIFSNKYFFQILLPMVLRCACFAREGSAIMPPS